jgi:acyl carrier protein
MEVIQTTRHFILQNFLFDEDYRLGENASLLENSIIDSTGVLELVTFIEQTFGIEVKDQEITPDNLDSLASIAEYVRRKLACASLTRDKTFEDPSTADLQARCAG